MSTKRCRDYNAHSSLALREEQKHITDRYVIMSDIYLNRWPNVVHSQCQVCRCSYLHPLYCVEQSSFSYLMMLCDKCKHIQVGRTSSPAETKKEVCEYFTLGGLTQDEKWSEWSHFWGDCRKPAFTHMLRTIKRLGFEKGRLLDVGSAFGHFLDLAQSKGYDVFGVDTSSIARRLARDKFNIETFATLDDVPTSIRPFDIIVCSETLYLHPDVRVFLGQMRQKLKTNGLLVIKLRCNRTAIMRLVSMFYRWRNNSLLELRPGQYLYGISLSAYHLFRTWGIHRLLHDMGFRIVQTVSEKTTIRRGFAIQTIPQMVSIVWSSFVYAVSLGSLKIGREITIYAVPSLE